MHRNNINVFYCKVYMYVNLKYLVCYNIIYQKIHIPYLQLHNNFSLPNFYIFFLRGRKTTTKYWTKNSGIQTLSIKLS